MTEKVEGLSEKEVEQLSGIEFQSQSYASFYNTTLEKDKSILTLSVAGIGFLLTQKVAVMDSCLLASELHKSFQGASALQGTTQQQTSAQSQSTGAAAMMPNSNSSSSSSDSSGS
ncbi:hypothetical protein NMR63_003370 [Vibrio cholerae]|nr:hypothetical protein [Vibrio cholerae]